MTPHITSPRKSIRLRNNPLDISENLAQLIIDYTFLAHQAHQLGQHVWIGHILQRLIVIALSSSRIFLLVFAAFAICVCYVVPGYVTLLSRFTFNVADELVGTYWASSTV